MIERMNQSTQCRPKNPKHPGAAHYVIHAFDDPHVMAGNGTIALEILEDLPDVDTMTCDLLTPELADPISKASRVVFVDAAVDADEVQLRPLSPSESSQIVAHAADPRTMLALARDVFGQAPRAWWLTIPVENLSLDENLSDLAKKGIGQAIEAILGLARSGC